MDWNWFFSSLAQSTAAIVGLIGAFVFTKMVNSEGASEAATFRLNDLGVPPFSVPGSMRV